jgi:hypothetical protein
VLTLVHNKPIGSTFSTGAKTHSVLLLLYAVTGYRVQYQETNWLKACLGASGSESISRSGCDGAIYVTVLSKKNIIAKNYSGTCCVSPKDMDCSVSESSRNKLPSKTQVDESKARPYAAGVRCIYMLRDE